MDQIKCDNEIGIATSLVGAMPPEMPKQCDIPKCITQNLNVWTVYTLTLPPSYYDWKAIKQLDFSVSLLKKYLTKLNIMYFMRPEDTIAGNIHYHCLFAFETSHNQSLFNNWYRRKFEKARTQYATVVSNTEEYDEINNFRYKRRTSLLSIWRYMNGWKHGEYEKPIYKMVTNCDTHLYTSK